ncbi:MAG: hypothetical protein P8J68_01210 [Arenicellaceae bacterium]|nr:hypothetical protein [Arenicellaceae bacterium]
MNSISSLNTNFSWAKNRPLLSCLFVWGIVNVLHYAYLGIRTGGDTGRYTGSAIEILNGNWPAGKAVEYMGYNIFVAFSQLISPSYLFETIVVLQVLVSAVAVICLYKIAEIYGSTLVAIFASLAWIIFPDTQYWNFLILTESLFVSALLISLYAILRSETRMQVAISLVIVIFTASIRPNGLIVLVAAYCYFLVASFIKKDYLALSAIVFMGLLGLTVSVNMLGAIVERQEIVESFIKGETIWGYPQSYNPLPDSSSASLIDGVKGIPALFNLVLAEPIYFIEVVFTKLFYLLSHTRPYWSTYHNIYALFFILPLYALLIYGIFYRTAPIDVVSFAYPLITTQLLVVAFSFADWDGRHLLPIYPFFCLLAGFSAAKLFGFLSLQGIGAK